MKITAKTKICMVIGDPIDHSLSPQMHNAGYSQMGIDNEFVFVACVIKKKDIEDFIKGVRVMGIHGISVTLPHKTEIMKYLDEIDEAAKKIGAVNTIVNNNVILKGYNTDWLGIVQAIEKVTSLKDKKVALLGAGGVARAAAYGVILKGAQSVILFNRTAENAQKLAAKFDSNVTVLNQIEEIGIADIIINTTSVGMYSIEDRSLINKELITRRQTVFDVIYNPYETQLIIDAKEQGAQIIHGLDMFLAQGIEQFKLFTGHDAPEGAMKNILLKELLKMEN